MDIRLHRWDECSSETRASILARAQQDIAARIEDVRPIVDRVRRDGDAALVEFTERFEGARVPRDRIAVRPEEFDDAERALTAQVRAALEFAVENVRRVHETQLRRALELVEVRPGLWAGERSTPIDAVGLYVPSGRGSFPSMLYMLAVPATLAGCPTIAITTPPRHDGRVDPAVLTAARICGVETVYRIGGAQAIAALAYGTATVPPVNKIVGPGSAYVAAAKRLVADIVDVGLPAGPSESIVLADGSADAWRVALDLMIEAEHGSDSSALLVTPDESLAERVIALLRELIPEVPGERRSFLEDVFSGYGGIVVTRDIDQAIEVTNAFATEHLLIHARDARAIAAQVRNAGEILIGPHSAFSLANYAAGANAVLPTGGWARSWGPVSVRDFEKRSSLVEISETAYREMRDHVIALADYEGFHTHAAALRRRDER